MLRLSLHGSLRLGDWLLQSLLQLVSQHALVDVEVYVLDVDVEVAAVLRLHALWLIAGGSILLHLFLLLDRLGWRRLGVLTATGLPLLGCLLGRGVLAGG